MTELKNEYPKNSLFYWYPLIKDLDIPMPETIMIPFPENFNFLPALDRKPVEGYSEYLMKIAQELEKSGLDLPVFLRTDETSNKHGWNKTCYLTDIKKLPEHIWELLEFTEMAGWMGGLNVNGFVLREFLELDKRFTAFHGRMPVAKEFRLFVKNGKFQCYHPYWFPACMISPSVENWYDELMDMENISTDELELLTNWAEKIGKIVGDYWSIDFCQLKDKNWAMTDMAQGEDSFHWSTCKYASEVMKQYGDPYKMPEKWKLMTVSKEEKIIE